MYGFSYMMIIHTNTPRVGRTVAQRKKKEKKRKEKCR